jgi:hypothetical protein
VLGQEEKARINAAKTQMLGVPEPLIEAKGAVSAEVAEKMAEGVRRAGNTTLVSRIGTGAAISPPCIELSWQPAIMTSHGG